MAVLLAAVTLAVVPGCRSATGQPGPSAPAASSASSSAAVAGPVSAAEAMSELAALPVVASRPHRPGYQRGCGRGQACSFGPAWSDDTTAPGGHNGCDTRDDLIFSSMSDVVYKGGSRCVVESGTLADPYTGSTIHFTKSHATAVQADHVVPLALAWDLGAAGWTQPERDAYANDESLVLVVVDGPTNVLD